MGIFPFAIFKVEGESMLPDFHPGDFIVVNRWAYVFRNPKVEDVVVAKDPRNSKRIMIKKVLRVEKEELFLKGDNEERSTDSRTFGLIPKDKVVGKVFLCFRKNGKSKTREEAR